MTASVSAREAELRAMPLWVGTDSVALGGWVLRTVPHAPGRKLRRTNSCLTIGEPGLALGDAVDRVRAFYAARGRAPLAHVEVGSDVERALLGLGWRPLLAPRGSVSPRAARWAAKSQTRA